MREQWKIVEGYPNYRVSNKGRLQTRHKRGGRGKIGPWYDAKLYEYRGYYIYSLSNKKEKKIIRVHRLVALAFLKNPNKLPEVNHIDWNKLNNNVSNLEWISKLDNQRHCHIKYPLCQQGEKNPRAILTEKQVIKIRSQLKNGVYGTVLAKLYKVHKSTICKIKRGKAWKHVT